MSAARMAVVAAALLLGAAGSARAYPQWQFSAGETRCNQCHFAPAGGGLVNTHGRDAVAEELSTFAGDGAFLHGAVALPSWLALGGDFRGAFLAHDAQDPNGTKLAVFPMQAEIAARVRLGEKLSIYASGGVRGQVRDNSAVVPDRNYQPITASQVVSREHYLTWQPASQGIYVRVGRFYAPFGLRLAEHGAYVRRDLGFNMLEETYNISEGWVDNVWELHVTLFAPDVLRTIGSREAGLAAYAERRLFNQQGAVGLQARAARGPGMTRLIGGGVGKYYLERLRTLFLVEANLVHQIFDTIASRQQLVGAAGFALLPVRGLMFTALAERSHADISAVSSATTAGTAMLSWFPYPHLEIQVMGRLQFPWGTAPARTVLAQVHYSL